MALRLRDITLVLGNHEAFVALKSNGGVDMVFLNVLDTVLDTERPIEGTMLFA